MMTNDGSGLGADLPPGGADPIPFTVTILKNEIDKELPGKLLTEAEGILAWAVAGARLWCAEGLAKPV